MHKTKLLKTILVSTVIFIGMLSASPVTHAEGIKKCDTTNVAESPYSYNTFITDSAGQKITNFNIDTARVVELTEPMQGSNLTSDGKQESIIIDAYKGTCCVEEVKGNSCGEMANIYTDGDPDGFVRCEKVAGTGMCIPIQLLISMNGISLLKFYILQVYIWAASVVGIIAVLVIVISGIQLAASGGSDQLSSAKTRITQSLAGLAILFLSALILYTINPTFFTR